MDPPELLVPLILLDRMSLLVQEVKYPPMLLIPSELRVRNQQLFALLNQEHILEANRDIEKEPDGFVAVARVDQPGVKAIQHWVV